LAVLCWRGIYVRYRADDYWTASVVARLGFWKSQTWWYQRWSGRFSYTFLIGILEALGPRFLPMIAPVTIACWLAATYLFFKRMRSPFPAAIAGAFVYAASECAPDVPQSLFWQTGIVTYVVPLVGLTAWLITTVDRERVAWYDVVVPFLLAGFSESNTIAQVIALAAVTLVLRDRRRIFGTALIASIAALIVVGAAPGNAVRMSVYPRHAIAWVTQGTLANTSAFLINEARGHGVGLVLVLVAAMLFAPRARKEFALAAAAVAISSAVMTQFATLLTIGFPAPQRTMFVPHFLLVIAIASIGAAVQLPQEAGRFAVPVLVLLTIGGPLVDAAMRARDIADAAAFARAWDRLDADLRRNEGREVVVDGAPGNAGTLMFITHDRDKWANRIIADYYGLTGIAAAPPGRSMVGELLENFPVYATEGPRRHDDNHVLRLRFASD
jgi:hypothetical protein